MLVERTSKARFHPRVEADLMVVVQGNEGELRAKAKDVSLAGLSLQGYSAQLAERLTVAIPLPGEQEVIADCEVCRRRGSEVGLKFRRLNWDHFFALARYLYPRLP